MKSSSDFTMVFALGALGFIAMSAVFGIIIGGTNDPQLEAASWFIMITVFVVAIIITALFQFPKLQK